MLARTTESPVLLLGVAHVVDLKAPLRRVLEGRTLDGVALELDDERAHQVLSPQPGPRDRGGAPIFLRLWAHLQQRLGDEWGTGAGGEMRAAAEIAKERSLPIFLIDDPIRETLRRLIGSMSLKERVSLVLGGLLGLVLPSRFVQRQLDDYAEAPTEYLEAVRSEYPALARVLLDDRNAHMADRLAELRRRGYGRVAAVVGDAHVPGLTVALQQRGIPVESIPFATLRGEPRASAPGDAAAPPASR